MGNPLFFPACIAVVAIILLIIIGTNVSRCVAGGNGEEAQQVEQVEEVQDQNTLNPDIAEELRWRDEDFAVDPARTDWVTKDNGRKVVYLTIDDGPSNVTERMLDLFDQYNVKATFFVTAQEPEYFPLIHEAYKRGHTIGLHSYSHDYAEIYSSESAFLKDLDKIGEVVKEQIGYVPCFFRFPGGSSNTISADYAEGMMTKLTKEMNAQGYQYWDWNLDTGDGSGYSTMEMLANVLPDGAYDDKGNFVDQSAAATEEAASEGAQSADSASESGWGGFDNPTDLTQTEPTADSASSEEAESVDLDNIDELDDYDELEGIDELDDEEEGYTEDDYPSNIVLLCHDASGKEDTLAALPAIIQYFQSKGYTFEAMDRKTMVSHHEVNN